MNRLHHTSIAAALTLLFAGQAAAQDAGRVLAAAGDVSIVRDGQKITGQAGVAVRPGDTIELGNRSNAQVRFTDASIVALRSDTSFRVAEYRFDDRDETTGRAFFNLLKGGMRTVTGLIGRRNSQNYGVQTATATIGIRGTHYTLVECQGNCRNPDGSLAPNGTYGSVTDGRIGVTNQSGERQFGADQVFHVATPTSAPQPLIAPPGFLRDALEGRARATSQQQQAAARQGGDAPQPATAAQARQAAAPVVAPAGQGGTTTGDTRVSATVSTTAPVETTTTLTTNTFQAPNDFGVVGPAAVIQPGFTGTVFYRANGPFNIPVSCSNPPCSTVVAGEFSIGVNFALQRAGITAVLLGNDGSMVNVSTPINSLGVPIRVSGNQVTFDGTFALADYPNQQGSFRCNDCGPGNGPGQFQSVGFSGTINGTQATLVVTATDDFGPGSVSATLTKVDVPNSKVAAIVIPASGGGATAASNAYFSVTTDAAGQLTRFGSQNAGATFPAGAPANGVGRLTADVGNATIQTVGSDLAAGNLVWGKWTGPGAKITDGNYVSFTTGNGAVQPWITGDVTNTLSPALGVVTYVPVGSFISTNGATFLGGSLTADFVNQQISLNLTARGNPAAGNNLYTMSSVSGISPTTSRFSSGFNTVTCSGGCNGGVGTANGSYSGFFAGTQAQGAGLAFTVGFGAGAGPLGGGVSGVVGLKR